MGQTKQTIFDNGPVVIGCRMAGAERSPQIVVTFDERFRCDPSQPGFGEDFLIANGIDLITVQKRTDEWYRDLGPGDFAGAVSAIIARYDRTYLYGSSMGAHAALYFSPVIAGRALAFSPVHPSFCISRGVTAYGTEFTADPLASATPSVLAPTVLYDPGDIVDGPYINECVAMAFPNAVLVPVRHGSHPAHTSLMQSGTLKDFVLRYFREGQVDRDLIKASRARSWDYSLKLAAQCAARGHRRWASSLGERAMRLKPNDSRVEKLVAAL